MSLAMGKFTRKCICLSVLLLIFILDVNADDATPTKKLKVKIYYETLCPDSTRFIRNQLLYSMNERNRYNFTDIKFVPYGHVMSFNDSKTHEKVMNCQHGKKECELNAQHACVIENNTERETFDLISCMMSRNTNNIEKCATKFGINYDAARICKETKSIVEILEKHGLDTDSLNPSFIPAISIEDKFDWDEQNEILESFDAVFCRRYEQKFNIKLSDC